MAGSVSDWAENKLLDHLVGKLSWTMVSPIYIGLWTATLSDTSTGSTAGEVSTSGTAYARQPTGASHWESASSGHTQNASVITFPTATAAWGTVTYFALLDQLATGGGNILAWADLDASKNIQTGDTASFAAGDLDVTMS